MRFRDRLPYSAFPDRPKRPPPAGKRLIVWPIVNVEDWDEAHAMPRQVLTAPSGAQVVPDLPNWAWHEYGMRVGFWRMLELFARLDIRPTLSVNGRVIDGYPRVAAAARDAGWEFMGHGWYQRPMHLVEDQAEVIRRTIGTAEAFTGRRMRGWLGPGLTETAETTDLLKAAGLDYVADWVLDEQPVQLTTVHGPIWTMPYSVELNDIPMMMIQHHAAEEFTRRVLAQAERMAREGAETTRIMGVAMHPYISGVPHRFGAVEAAFEALAARPDVLFMTGEAILDWWTAGA